MIESLDFALDRYGRILNGRFERGFKSRWVFQRVGRDLRDIESAVGDHSAEKFDDGPRLIT